MHRALKPGGVVCTQGESQWYHLEIIKSLAAMCKQVFTGGSVQYAYTTIPTYPRCSAWLASGRGEGWEVPGESRWPQTAAIRQALCDGVPSALLHPRPTHCWSHPICAPPLPTTLASLFPEPPLLNPLLVSLPSARPCSGQIGFMICCKGEQRDASVPRLPPPTGGAAYGPLRYYNSAVHRAAFVLPTFAQEALAPSMTF